MIGGILVLLFYHVKMKLQNVSVYRKKCIRIQFGLLAVVEKLILKAPANIQQQLQPDTFGASYLNVTQKENPRSLGG